MISKHAVIVDDFHEQPHAFRKIALELEYLASPHGVYSGKRTLSLHHTHSILYERIKKRILKYYDLNPDDYHAEICFHITEGVFGEEGWVHNDYPAELAAILYLNPSINDLNSGTSLFCQVPNYKNDNLKSSLTMRKSFLEEKDNLKTKKEYNSKFIKTVTVGGKFNRLVIYPGDMFHAGEGYFGTDISNSRLTLVSFFYKKNIK